MERKTIQDVDSLKSLAWFLEGWSLVGPAPEGPSYLHHLPNGQTWSLVPIELHAMPNVQTTLKPANSPRCFVRQKVEKIGGLPSVPQGSHPATGYSDWPSCGILCLRRLLAGAHSICFTSWLLCTALSKTPALIEMGEEEREHMCTNKGPQAPVDLLYKCKPTHRYFLLPCL